ncbi:hypothetical protein, partial [Staphylococcus aureus]
MVLLRGAEAVAQRLGLSRSRTDAVVVIENLHGHPGWKSFVRKLFRVSGSRLRLAITTLDTSRVPGKSLPSD